MIQPDAIGELKDGAAGLVALSELFASRRVGPKSIARSLGSVVEACAHVERAAERLATEVLAVTLGHPEAAGEVRRLFDRAATAVRALSVEADTAARAAMDARTRLVLERSTLEAGGRVAVALFAGELFAAAAAPRPVTVRVADVLSFGPMLPDGPTVLRATLEVPSEPVTTTDARLLRALVELCVQVVASSGASPPHVDVTGGQAGTGARVRVGPPRGTPGPPTGHPRAGGAPPAAGALLTVRKLPWNEGAASLARAAAAMAGALASIDADGRRATLDLP